MNSGEKLACFIMNGVSNALDFLFEQFIHSAQSGNGFLKTAMSHFVRREDFRKKFAGQRSDLIEPVAAIPFANRKKECLLVNQDKFDEARTASHGLSAYLVSLAESRLILMKQVSLEGGRIVLRKSGKALFPLCSGRFHCGPPKIRATRMSASSFPL